MAQQWYQRITGSDKPQGPFSGQEMIERARSGALQPNNSAWMEGTKPRRASEYKALARIFDGSEECRKDIPAKITSSQVLGGWLDHLESELKAGRTVTFTKSELRDDLDLLRVYIDNLKVVDNGSNYSLSLGRSDPDGPFGGGEPDIQGGQPGSRSTHLDAVECPNCGDPDEFHPNLPEVCNGCGETMYRKGRWYWLDGEPFSSDDGEYDDAEDENDDVDGT